MKRLTKIMVIATILIFTTLSIGMLVSDQPTDSRDQNLIESGNIQSDLIMLHPDYRESSR